MTQKQFETVKKDFDDFCLTLNLDATIDVAIEGSNKQFCSYSNISYDGIELKIVDGLLCFLGGSDERVTYTFQWIDIEEIASFYYAEHETIKGNQ